MISASDFVQQMRDMGFLDPKHLGIDYAKPPVGESYPLPKHRKYETKECVTDESKAHYDKDYAYRIIGAALGKLLALAADIDLHAVYNPLDYTTEITGSVYVFNEEQMREFIREVEDAVKERLAQ